jgi:hypothetical protein
MSLALVLSGLNDLVKEPGFGQENGGKRLARNGHPFSRLPKKLS